VGGAVGAIEHGPAAGNDALNAMLSSDCSVISVVHIRPAIAVATSGLLPSQTVIE
jgi:hypothetical protein